MTRSGSRLLLAATAASCVAFLLFLPRAVEPTELPALVLDREAQDAAIARDARARRRNDADAMRARAADEGERALREAARLGDRATSSEAAIAERYGLVRRGRTDAPRVVVRALFKARWNASEGREVADGFTDVERRAYYGWLALEAPDAPIELRELALETYGEAGGEAHEEALAFFHAVRGHHGDAFLRYAALYRATGELRYRNHARWAALAMD